MKFNEYGYACGRQRKVALTKRLIDFDKKYDINKGHLPPRWVLDRCLEIENMVRWMMAQH